MNILGISSHYHDSAGCLLADGRIVAAAHEERFTRIKHDSSFPARAIAFCLSQIDGGAKSIDRVAFYDNWALKRRRSLETALRFGSESAEGLTASAENWWKERDFIDGLCQALGWSRARVDADVHCIQHHFSHAASAYYCSPFDESAVVTVDGVGEYSTTTLGHGKNARLALDKSIDFPHSLGLLYSSITRYLGFKVNSGEYKVMGLAPYGEPAFLDRFIDKVISFRDDGSFQLDLDYFGFHVSRRMCDFNAMENLFGFPPRDSGDPIETRHKDLAASVQAVIEQAMERLIRASVEETGCRNVSLAGGVALNCSALGKIRNLDLVDDLFVQPAAGDAGGAMGAALALHYGVSDEQTKGDPGFTVYCGPAMKNDDARAFFLERGCPHDEFADDDLVEKVAGALADGQSVAWCRGEAEWGPRALGGRSIIASPLVPDIKNTLNMKIKQREGFRPFAPIISADHVGELFQNPCDSPYMSIVLFLQDSLRAPNAPLAVDGGHLTGDQFLNVKNAVIHEDFSARVQTVTPDRNGLFHAVLRRFFELTGCPLLINTSFNARGEPMVLNASDAFRCFMRTQVDRLVVGNFMLDRARQPLLEPHEIEQFEPD